MDDYVTGMTLIGKPGAGSACPPIVWLVESDTPAAKAGIQPGDRLVAIDGKRVADVVEARSLLRASEAKSSTIEFELCEKLTRAIRKLQNKNMKT